MEMDTLDTAWILYHMEIIFNLIDATDFDHLALACPLLGRLIKTQKARFCTRIFPAKCTSPKDYYQPKPYRPTIEHIINAQGINRISVIGVKPLADTQDYTIVKLVNSDNITQQVDNMSRVVYNRIETVSPWHTYVTEALPQECDVIYQLDTIQIEHSPCTILSTVITYYNHLELPGQMTPLSPTRTEIKFSETPYTVPSKCFAYHEIKISVITDIEISMCNIHVGISQKIGIDEEVTTHNHLRQSYPCLNHIMFWHGFQSGMVGLITIHCFGSSFGCVLCKTQDAPHPDRRFTVDEIVEWLKKYQIVQINF